MKDTVLKSNRATLLTSIFALLMFLTLGANAFGQVSVTATAGTTGPAAYTTVNAAFAAVNAGTHQGVITITVTANTIEPTPPTPLLQSASPSSYTAISIVPSGNVSIGDGAAATAGGRGMLEFLGADNVTINGDDPLTAGTRNLIIQAPTGTATFTGISAVRYASNSSTDGATNNIVRNCVIIGPRPNSVSVTAGFYGIYSGTPGTAAQGVSGQSDNNDNLTIENNQITRAAYGIYAAGNATSANYMDNLIIRNNDMGAGLPNAIAIRGIYLQNTQATASANSAIVEGNDIRTTASTTGTTTTNGIEIANGNAGAEIRRNRIHDIRNPNTAPLAAYGISVTGATSNAGVTISNNFIYDVTNANNAPPITATSANLPVGIRVSAGATGLKIYHNSISLNAANVTPANPGISAAIQITVNTVTGSDIRGNIISNTQTGAAGSKYYGVVVPAGFPFGTINFNDYNASTATNIIGWNGADVTTLGGWQAVTMQDANSLAVDPQFITTNDLHLKTGSPLINPAGSPTLTTVDIDNETRDAASDIGADEYVQVGSGTLAGGTYTNVVVNSSAGFTMTGNVTVNGVLTLQNQTLNTNGFTLTIECSGTITGGSGTNNNYITGGNLTKQYCSNGTTFTYPVGAGGYSPVTLTATTLGTNPASLTASVFNTTLPGVLTPSKMTNRYWNLSNSGISSASLIFVYLPADVLQGDPQFYRIIKDTNGAPPFVLPDGGVDDVNEATFTGTTTNPVTSFSNWAIGEISATAADVPIGGRVQTADRRGIRNAMVTLIESDGTTHTVMTGTFGYYRFADIQAGQSVIISVRAKRYNFKQSTQLVNVNGKLDEVNFFAVP